MPWPRSDRPNTVQRDLKVFDRPGTEHQAVYLFVQDKWQARSNITIDLGLRWEYYTPLQGLEGKGSLSNYDPAIHSLRVSGYGDLDNALNVEKNFSNFNPRTGISWRLNQLTVVRAGYGAGTIPFPDNRYAFSYPVKQNYQGSSANGFQRAGSMAVGFPAPALLDIPSTGIIPGRRNGAAERHAGRDPDHAARGHAALLERRVPAAASVQSHRGHRLCRQPRCRSRDGRRQQRRLGVWRRQCRQRLCAFNRTRRQPDAHERRQVDTTGSRSRSIAGSGRVPPHQLVYAQPVEGLREREHDDRDTDRLESQLWPIELRSPANYVATALYELLLRPGKLWLNEGCSPASSAAGS